MRTEEKSRNNGVFFTNFNFLRGTNYMVPFNDSIHIRFFNVKNIPTHYSIQTREIKVNRLNKRTQNKIFSKFGDEK